MCRLKCLHSACHTTKRITNKFLFYRKHNNISFGYLLDRIKHLYKKNQTEDYELIFKQNTVLEFPLLLALKITQLEQLAEKWTQKA